MIPGWAPVSTGGEPFRVMLPSPDRGTYLIGEEDAEVSKQTNPTATYRGLTYGIAEIQLREGPRAVRFIANRGGVYSGVLIDYISFALFRPTWGDCQVPAPTGWRDCP